jgi:hypothetical protein
MTRMQGFQYCSCIPVLHYLQPVLSLKFDHFLEYPMQQSLKLVDTMYYFKWIKVPGTAPCWQIVHDNYSFITSNWYD